MIEVRNVLNVYSELNPQIDMIFIVSEDNMEYVYDLLNQAYDNWFNLEMNPELQSVPIGDYLSDELIKANIYHEIYFRNTNRRSRLHE